MIGQTGKELMTEAINPPAACVCGAKRIGVSDGVAVYGCGSTWTMRGFERTEGCRKAEERT